MQIAHVFCRGNCVTGTCWRFLFNKMDFVRKNSVVFCWHLHEQDCYSDFNMAVICPYSKLSNSDIQYNLMINFIKTLRKEVAFQTQWGQMFCSFCPASGIDPDPLSTMEVSLPVSSIP